MNDVLVHIHYTILGECSRDVIRRLVPRHRTFLYPAKSESRETKERADVNLHITSLNYYDLYNNHDHLWEPDQSVRMSESEHRDPRPPQTDQCCFFSWNMLEVKRYRGGKETTGSVFLFFLSRVSVVMCMGGLDFAGPSWGIRGRVFALQTWWLLLVPVAEKPLRLLWSLDDVVVTLRESPDIGLELVRCAVLTLVCEVSQTSWCWSFIRLLISRLCSTSLCFTCSCLRIVCHGSQIMVLLQLLDF